MGEVRTFWGNDTDVGLLAVKCEEGECELHSREDSEEEEVEAAEGLEDLDAFVNGGFLCGWFEVFFLGCVWASACFW